MASQQQIKANRRNAQNGSGPQTPEGKAASGSNALKHGLLARDALLPEEDRLQFLEILTAFETEHQPAGPLEAFVISQTAAAEWRLRRISRIETGPLVSRLQNARDFDARKSQHDASLRSFYKALHELRSRQAIRTGPQPDRNAKCKMTKRTQFRAPPTSALQPQPQTVCRPFGFPGRLAAYHGHLRRPLHRHRHDALQDPVESLLH